MKLNYEITLIKLAKNIVGMLPTRYTKAVKLMKMDSCIAVKNLRLNENK